MPNTIRIEPEMQQLTRGEALRVPIMLTLEQPLKVRGVRARFHGAEETKAEYTTTSTDSKGHVQTHKHTAVEQIDIVKQDHLLAGNPKLGFFGNLQDAAATLVGGGKHEVMMPGEYAYSIEVAIPADASATHKGQKTRVFYELSVEVDVPLARDLRATQSFEVLPLPNEQEPQPVVARYPDEAGRGWFDSMFGANVRIEMALASDRCRLGESIDGIVVIDTEKDLSCRAIRARLVAYERSQAQGHNDSSTFQGPAIELAKPGTISGSFKHEFSLPAEAGFPLSARGQKFSIDWFVQIEFDVPWSKDPKIQARITLLPAE
jgi:hypothetical protein